MQHHDEELKTGYGRWANLEQICDNVTQQDV